MFIVAEISSGRMTVVRENLRKLVDEWVKLKTFTQETSVRVPCETKLMLSYLEF